MLNTVQGIMNISSTGDISTACNEFNPLASGAVHGAVYCSSGSSDSTSSGSGTSSGSSTTSSGSSASHSSAASTSYGAPQFTLFGVLAAAFGLLM